jgi:hypothetical protein
VHCGEDVQQWLNATYLGRWIRRGGPIALTPRLPDVTHVEFFLWGHLKEQHICTIPPRTIEDLVPGLQPAVTID